MRVISLWQPWAMFVPWREKNNETRSWFTSYRGPLLIHASKNIPGWVKQLWYEEPFTSVLMRHGVEPHLRQLPFGQVVGICNLVDCVMIAGRTTVNGITAAAHLENKQIITGNELAFGDYSPGRFAWVLDNIHQLKVPIPAKGMQGLWNWDESTYMVSIDPYAIGSTKIWTSKGVISGRKLEEPIEDGLEGPDQDAVEGLEVA